ncbi:PIG-L family deacetylase [Arthrobacter rhombi]|uniref:PIG-L family deacetylase n=1 Tax=Arthrobacter rhombi TaxID=71253 RepID=UPI003FD1DFE4
MVSFRHDEAGTTERAWVEAGILGLPALEPGLLPGRGGKLVVIASHPDDETLGAGGLIFSALNAGANVHVIVCTSGEASHPDSLTHGPERLAALRQTELATALGMLAADAPGAETPTWSHLGLPDGRLNQYRTVLEDALESALQPEAPDIHVRADISGAPAPWRPVVAAPYRFDGHTDHDTAGASAASVCARFGCALLEYPIWYWHWAHPTSNRQWAHWKSLVLRPAARVVKSKALMAHQSQIAPLSHLPGDEVLLSEAFQEHFRRPTETFQATPRASRGSKQAAGIFDGLYRQRPDPWNYVDSGYEKRKRAVTLASLPADHYEYVIEAGCSIGVLTADLATRCSFVLGLDASEVALASARDRLAEKTNVTLMRAILPRQWPATAQGHPDLAVVSEIGYFLTHAELSELLGRITATLRPGGHLLLCHWLHPVEGWELNGEIVHAAAATLGWHRLVLHRETDFLLEVFERPENNDV